MYTNRKEDKVKIIIFLVFAVVAVSFFSTVLLYGDETGFHFPVLFPH